MTGDIDDDVRSYLSAVGALAVFVVQQDNAPVRVGFAHDPQKALAYTARRWPRAEYAWMSWFEDSKPNAANFVVEIMEHAGEMITVQRDDGTKVQRQLQWVIGNIESIAAREKIILTPHAVALNRAKLYAQRLDAALATLQQNGQFAAFNRAYRMYREQQRMRSESALPYWAAKEQMRQTIIKWLVTHPRIDPAALVTEIREKFPWFKQYGRTHMGSRSNSTG